MNEPEYRMRLSAVRSEQTFRLGLDALVCLDAKGGQTRLPCSDIRAVRVYRSLGIGNMAPAFLRCTIRPRKGRAIVLSSNHFVGLGRFEDRSASFRPFVQRLLEQVAAVSPQTVFRAGMPPFLWGAWAVLLAACAILVPLLVIYMVVSLVNGRGIEGPLIIVLGILMALFLSTFSHVRDLRRNRSRRFDPRQETVLDEI